MLFDGQNYPDKLIRSSSGHCLCEDCCRQRPEREAELREFLRLATTTSAGRFYRKTHTDVGKPRVRNRKGRFT